MTYLKCRQIKMLTAFILSALVLLSCGRISNDRNRYIHFEQIDANGWSPEDFIIFQPWPEDSVSAGNSKYQIDLVLRYSSINQLESLPIAILIEDNERTIACDTVIAGHETEVPGVFSEKEQFGVREITLTIDRNVTLTDGFSVTLNPLLPQANTKGLLNVGLILSPE